MKAKQTSLTDSKTYPSDAEALTLEVRGSCRKPAGLLQQLFHLIRATSLRALQSVLNAAARLVMRKWKYDRITATLRDDLHGCLSGSMYLTSSARWCIQVPAYVRSSLFDRNVCSCRCQHWAPVPIRSASHGDLTVPRTRTSKYGPHSFVVVGPSIWNSLPPAICQ